MPTYQYACTDCDHRFEAVQSFSDPSLTTCPQCGGKLRKVYGSVGVVFKGSGFYRTDSRSGAKSAGSPAADKPSSAKDSDSSSKKSESKKSESTTSASSTSAGAGKPAATSGSSSGSSSTSSGSSTN